MKRLIVICLAISSMYLGGCQFFQSYMPPEPIPPIASPDYGKPVIIDHAIYLVDASGSMAENEKFDEAKALLMEMVRQMPAGDYGVSVDSFAGPLPRFWYDYPMMPFEANAMARDLTDNLVVLDGNTTMDQAVQMIAERGDQYEGSGALIILSDGLARAARVQRSCEDLLMNHPGTLCVYPVLIGADARGELLMDSLIEEVGCGSAWKSMMLQDPQVMRAFIGEVFLGEIDSDGDGVFDPEDECPDTPMGAVVDERGCWVLANLEFDLDQSAIKPEFSPILDEVAAVLKDNDDVDVRIDGHTDSRASDEYNMALSQRRAEAVVKALVKRGIPASRMESLGFGETQPIAPNDSEANMARNRRVEITPIQ